MNSKKAKKLRHIAVQIADKEQLSEAVVYGRIKKISRKNKKLKV